MVVSKHTGTPMVDSKQIVLKTDYEPSMNLDMMAVSPVSSCAFSWSVPRLDIISNHSDLPVPSVGR